MTYRRVIPRDLFNEASLLKCYGQLYLNLEKLRKDDCLQHVATNEPFRIRQDPSDGSLTIQNVIFCVKGQMVHLYRPLNARSAYPLWARPEGCDAENDLQVFETNGMFTEEMLHFLMPR